MSLHAASWREERPIFVAREAPCHSACPAGENVQAWLQPVQSAQYQAAWRALTYVNPLPATMGRICYHACETACNRARMDGAVDINAVERFLGDEAIARGWRFDPPSRDSTKRVLVVGSGPSGLSAAYHLRRMGHAVEVRDRAPAAGGMMRYGIPTYRLPRAVLDAEIARIAEMGVAFRLGTAVETVARTDFDAVYVATGAGIARRADFDCADPARVVDAIAFLAAMESGERPRVGERVAVYGGGNTALDAARTARRLGAREVTIVYRRTRGLMPAHADELDEALAEGITVRWLTTIKAAHGDGTITVEAMALDPDGRPQPTGHRHRIECDSVILALGQDADLSAFGGGVTTAKGLVDIGPDMATSVPGIFAGGDVARSVRTATVAVGDGRAAARSIDAFLRGAAAKEKPAREPAGFETLHTSFYPPSARTARAKLAPGRRVLGFEEVEKGLDDRAAHRESLRCLSCGNCFSCGNCRDACPEDAVRYASSGNGFVIDVAACTTCKLCIKECPCGAIALAPR